MTMMNANATKFLNAAAEGTDPMRFVARITLEFDSPVLIGSGEQTKENDRFLVRDIHGLPLLPGTSIAGILAHSLRTKDDQPDLDVLRQIVFGFAETQAKDQDVQSPYGSRLKISDGYFHDALDKPVAQKHGVVDGAEEDPVIAIGRTGLRRDRVRINGRGTADGSGKFDALHCPAGARFTFELELGWGARRKTVAKEDEMSGEFDQGFKIWRHLLALLNNPLTRFGSYTRSGLGVSHVESVKEACFWLASDENERWQKPSPPEGQSLRSFDEYLNLPVALGAEADCLTLRTADDDLEDMLEIRLKNVVARDTWLFGGENAESEADITPLLEPMISWNVEGGNRSGFVTEMPAAVMTGAGLKGALAHRVLYHIRRENAHWLGEHEVPDGKDPDLAALFGDVKEEGGKQTSHAGLLFFQDMRIELPEQLNLTHNVIDRFTSGVRRGLLFEEDVIFGGDFGDIVIHIDKRNPKRSEAPSHTARKALKAALEDFARGWLPLGGGTGRGHGSFEANFTVNDDLQDWFEGGAE